MEIRRAVGSPQMKKLQSLIFGQAGDSDDTSSILAIKRPHIVVDESGGQPLPQTDPQDLILSSGQNHFRRK